MLRGECGGERGLLGFGDSGTALEPHHELVFLPSV